LLLLPQLFATFSGRFFLLSVQKKFTNGVDGRPRSNGMLQLVQSVVQPVDWYELCCRPGDTQEFSEVRRNQDGHPATIQVAMLFKASQGRKANKQS
jgi:hypothetical protein